MGRRIPRNVPAHFVLLPFCLFIVVPAVVLKENSEAFAGFDPAAFLILSILAAIVFVALLGYDFAQRKAYDRPIFSKSVELLFFFVVITGLVLPASVASGMKDPSEVPADVVHVAIALVSALALLLLAGSKHRLNLYLAVTIFIFVNAAMALPALTEVVVAPAVAAEGSGRTGIQSVSRDKNILVLSLDGLSGSAVAELMNEHPDLARSFAGFTFFDRVASSSPATGASTATSLYGNANYKLDYETGDQLWDSNPGKLLTNRLDAGGYEVSTYGVYNKHLSDTSRRHVALVTRPPPSTLSLLNYGLARALTSVATIDGELASGADDAFDWALAFLHASDEAPPSRYSSSFAPGWKKNVLTPTVLDLHGYIDGLDASSPSRAAHFLHFTHTHFPVEFDRECRFRGAEKDWFEGHQDRSGDKEQTLCALTQVAGYLQKLRNLGVFDNSLIVLKSDHGKPVEYNDTDSIQSFAIRNHPLWGYGRYAPFLAIKDFGAPSEEAVHDMSPVLLDDLAITLCASAQIAEGCEAYGGYDLLGGDYSGIESSEVTVFVVASADSDFRYDTHEAVTVVRGDNILRSLHAKLSSEHLTSTVGCTDGIEVSAGESLDNGRHDSRSWLTWNDEGSSFLRLNQEHRCQSTRLLLDHPTVGSSEVDFDIIINGEDVDVTWEKAVPSNAEAGHTLALDISSGMPPAAGDTLVEVRPHRPGGIAPEILGVEFR